MSRYLAHIEAAKDEALKHGATFELYDGTKHLIGVISINGKTRKQALSRCVKGDQNICYMVRKYVRRAIEEMKSVQP